MTDFASMFAAAVAAVRVEIQGGNAVRARLAFGEAAAVFVGECSQLAGWKFWALFSVARDAATLWNLWTNVHAMAPAPDMRVDYGDLLHPPVRK